MLSVKKVRNEWVKAGRANPPTEEDLEQVHWVRCCNCGKHRALPKGVTMEEMLEVYGQRRVSGIVGGLLGGALVCVSDGTKLIPLAFEGYRMYCVPLLADPHMLQIL